MDIVKFLGKNTNWFWGAASDLRFQAGCGADPLPDVRVGGMCAGCPVAASAAPADLLHT